MLKDLLPFIFLIKGLACNLQTACVGIIFSILSAVLLIPLWGLFRGANPPRQPGDRCSRHRGYPCVRAGLVAARMRCLEADERHGSCGGRSEGKGQPCRCIEKCVGLLRGFRVSLDSLSQMWELNTLHFFYFFISVLRARVTSLEVIRFTCGDSDRREDCSIENWENDSSIQTTSDNETTSPCSNLSEHFIYLLLIITF